MLAVVAKFTRLGIVARYVAMAPEPSNMARGRALLTEYEREAMAGKHSDQRRYEARSRFRSRIQENLTEELEFLAEEEPDLLDELRGVVCEDE
jgi:hypothetical protein